LSDVGRDALGGRASTGAPPAFEFRKAGLSDVGALVNLRIEFMRIVKDGGIPDEEAWRAQLSARFSSDIASGELVAWICLDPARLGAPTLVATSGLAYPRAEHPRDARIRRELGLEPGEALLCNMYTVSEYRRHGLGSELLERSIEEARATGVRAIKLQPTDDSRALYLRRGFIPAPGRSETEELILYL
jgi:GNAT superfamily N-acetyltransferase